MMNDWYERFVKALQLNDKEERTQHVYARTVRMLIEFHRKSPDEIIEKDLQNYFLHRKNISNWSAKTMQIAYCCY